MIISFINPIPTPIILSWLQWVAEYGGYIYCQCILTCPLRAYVALQIVN